MYKRFLLLGIILTSVSIVALSAYAGSLVARATPTATPLAHDLVLQPSPSIYSQRGPGSVVPYNSDCYTACFTDLSAPNVVGVMQYYAGSFDGAQGFKGLPTDSTLRAQTCELMYVVFYATIPKECATLLKRS
jgi:hypothetical protein